MGRGAKPLPPMALGSAWPRRRIRLQGKPLPPCGPFDASAPAALAELKANTVASCEMRPFEVAIRGRQYRRIGASVVGAAVTAR